MDGTVIIRVPRLASIETTDHLDTAGNTIGKTHIVRIELKRLGWCSFGILAIGFALGALVF